MRYQIKLIRDVVPEDKMKKSEAMLRDLLTVMPTLREHKLEGEIQSKIRTLRSGRKQRHYTLEISRKFPTYDVENGKVIKELKVSKAITKAMDRTGKIAVVKELKDEIIQQIKELRKAQQPPVETFRFREGIETPKLAEVYLDHGVFLKVQNRRQRINITRGKAPRTSDNHVGVEIECASNVDIEQMADRLHDAGVSKHVHLHRDASIQTDSNFPHSIELSILCKQAEYADVITKVCKVLNDAGVRIDKSCGLHVHIDMRNRQPDKCFANLMNMQHLLYAMVPANRKTSRYSVPVQDKRWRVMDDHYAGVNTNAYQKHKTIELRMHCGTSKAKKINNWVALLLAIVDAPLITKAPTSIKAAQALIGISDELVTYAESRIAKFANQHKKVDASFAWMDKVEPVATLPDSVTQEEQSEVA